MIRQGLASGRGGNDVRWSAGSQVVRVRQVIDKWGVADSGSRDPVVRSRGIGRGVTAVSVLVGQPRRSMEEGRHDPKSSE